MMFGAKSHSRNGARLGVGRHIWEALIGRLRLGCLCAESGLQQCCQVCLPCPVQMASMGSCIHVMGRLDQTGMYETSPEEAENNRHSYLFPGCLIFLFPLPRATTDVAVPSCTKEHSFRDSVARCLTFIYPGRRRIGRDSIRPFCTTYHRWSSFRLS